MDDFVINGAYVVSVFAMAVRDVLREPGQETAL